MTQCKQSPQEFIKNAFTPQVAVMCTPQAEKLCEKNNLTFIELIQPFSRLNNDVYYKDISGNVVTVRNLKITLLDINTRPPEPPLARKYLNASVSGAPESKLRQYVSGDYKLDVPVATPWYEAWKDTFLKVQYPSDHEYTKHFLACLLVVASSDQNPAETMVQLAQSLNQMQNTAPGKLPKWFNCNVLKYYVVLHDILEGNDKIANDAFDSLKVSYGGANCFLLRMNSRPPGPQYPESNTDHLPDPWSQFINTDLQSKNIQFTPESSPSLSIKSAANLEMGQEANEQKSIDYHPLSPDHEELVMGQTKLISSKLKDDLPPVKVHGGCLSTEDIEQIKFLISEFCRCCLLPYIERQIHSINDAISNKKGVSKSLFSATKRWFSTNKPGTGTIAINNLIYSPDAPELQVRRLGDLYFMFGNYSAAFQAYHLAKRDYNADQAWLYYAGALEMASLSAFMANETSRKSFEYMEESITTYLNTCKMPQFATRATIISSECLKSKNMFGEAAHQLIRMTSEESDLRSALLLEQAAFCFLESKMIRKYAFHMVLAGHRFSKAAQRKHSLRCYKQAHQVYDGKEWDLSMDHIHYTIGRQGNNLQQYVEAVESFSHLLTGSSKQTAQQQAVFLKEYLTILGNKLENEGQSTLPVLPVPKINISSIKVLVGPTPPLTTPGKVPAMGFNLDAVENKAAELKWHKLEEMLVTEANNGVATLLFKPMITLYKSSDLLKINCVTAIVNEPIQISIELINLLQTVLHLKDIYLDWDFAEGKRDNEEEGNLRIKTHVTNSIIIEGNSKKDVVLSLTPLITGDIVISGICYTLTGSSSNTDNAIFVKGMQPLNLNTKGSDMKELHVTVVPPAPCLQVTFSELSMEFLTNQVQRVSIDFRNTGTVPLKNVYMATSVPHLISFSEFHKNSDLQQYEAVYEADIPAVRDKLARKNHITSVPLPNGVLESEHSTTIYLWLKAPDAKGPAVIDLLIYYENIDSKSIPKYRLVRHSWNLTVHDSINVEVTTQESYKSTKDEEISLALKAINLNTVYQSISTEIKLLNVGLLSNYWELNKNIVTPTFISLAAQETAHILLKAKRNIKETAQYSNISLSKDTKIAANLNSACLAFAVKTEHKYINLFEEAEKYCKKPEKKGGVLLMQWQASVAEINNKKDKRLVNGQSLIPVRVTRVKSENNVLMDTIKDAIELPIGEVEEDFKNPQKQVIYNLIHQAAIYNDFTKLKVCVVPIKFVIHCINQEEPVAVTINNIGSTIKTVSNLTLCYQNPSNQFRWVGNCKTKFTMEPLSTKVIHLNIAVTRPGTFDLGANIQVLCQRLKHSGELPIVQLCEIKSAIIVEQIKK